MTTSFHLRREGDRWSWRLIDDDGPDGAPLVLARSGDTYPTKGEANAAVEAARRAMGAADTVVDTTVPESRWRKIGPDGTIGEPVGDDPPDNDDEAGETGPPEVDLTPEVRNE